LLVRLIIIGCILGGIAVLLILVTPSGGDRLLGYLEDVDDTDKTPILLRYIFKPGQELVFESTAEVISTLRVEFGPGGGVMRMNLKPTFKVESVDENGVGTIEVSMKELTLETAAGMGKRKVEITSGEIQAYNERGETQLEEADLMVRDALIKPFFITVTPLGEVSLVDQGMGESIQVYQFRQFMSSFFFLLPEEKIAAGSGWKYEMPELGAFSASLHDVKSAFLGYKKFEGERCAVLRLNFTIEFGKDAQKGSPARDSGKMKYAGGLVFSLERGLPLVMFRRQEGSRAKATERGPVLRGVTDEEYVIKLLSSSESR